MIRAVISNVFGGAAIALTFAVFIRKKQRDLVLTKMLVNTLWVVYFFLRSWWGISATYTACAVQAVAVLRGVVALNSDKKWGRCKLWMWTFIILSWIGSALTWQGPICWLSAISSTCGTVMFWCKTPQISRWWGAATFLTWGIYAYATGSYLALASSVVAMLSIAVGFIRYA